jgi:hypothetical protein
MTGLLCSTDSVQSQHWADKYQHPPSQSQNLCHTMVPKDLPSFHCDRHCLHDWNGDVEHSSVYAGHFCVQQDGEGEMH